MTEQPQTFVYDIPEATEETFFENRAIQTYRGGQYDYRSPDPRDIDIYDIANALANYTRFGGHEAAEDFYSVAQHSVLVVDILRAQQSGLEIAQAGLLHDAHEAYLGDRPRPMKLDTRLRPVLKEMEEEADVAIAGAFEISTEALHDQRVKWADNAATINEAGRLLHNPPPESEYIPLPAVVKLHEPMPPLEAKRNFLRVAYELGLVGQRYEP